MFFSKKLYYTPGKGLSPEEAEKRTYFGILWRKLWKITGVNLIFILVNLIQIAMLIAMILPFFTTADSGTSAQLGEYLMQILNGKRLIPIYLVIPFMLMGPSYAGINHVCRSFAKQEPAFIWNDFIRAVKENIRQSLFAGIIISLVYYVYLNTALIYLNSGINLILAMVLVINLGLFITLATFYVYPLMITFDMKLVKIFKNSFILAIFNLPQNLAALAAILAVNGILLMTFPVSGWIPFTIFFLIAWAAYTTSYVTWNAIDKFLIIKE